MGGVSDPWVAFLTARLDEDEMRARSGHGGSVTVHFHTGAAPLHAAGGSGGTSGAPDQARALREVAAKRAILNEWEDADRHRYHLPEGVSEGRDDAERLRDDAVAEAMDTVIAHLAAVHSGHPDYPGLGSEISPSP